MNYLPPSVERVIPALRRAGQISFWIQVILGAVAAIILIFAIPNALSNSSTPENINPGRGPGIFFALTGLVSLGISIYWASRYTQLARILGGNSADRPSKSETMKTIQLGIVVNLVGMLFNLLAAETITGVLLGKALQSAGGGLSQDALRQLVQPLDILVVLANTHTLFAHFIGLTVSLWLLNWVAKSTEMRE